MEVATESAKAIGRASQNPSETTMLDASCKEVLAIKGVLAWILKDCVPEYSDVDVKDIENRYIEGDPQVAKIGIESGETGKDIGEYLNSIAQNTTETTSLTEGELISGLNTELNSADEGKVTFDIFFRAIAPKTGELIRFYVDVEAQNKTSTGYPLVKRAFYNVCRAVSSQKGREFLNDDYKNIKKVYTIWICPKSEEEWKRGTITRYYPQEECLVGQTREKKENYDLFEIRMIYLPAEEGKKGSGILRMLDKLLSPVTTREDKLDSLKNDFGVAITKQIERKVDAMCDYSSVVLKDGIEQGEEKLAKLINILLKAKKADEIPVVTENKKVREDYYKKYGLA